MAITGHRPRPSLGSRLRQIGMTVGGIVFLAIGIASFFVPDPNPVGGVAIVLFGLAVLIVPLARRTGRAERAAGARVDRVEHDGVLQPALVLDGNFRKRVLLVVCSALLAVLGALIAIAGDSPADTAAEAARTQVIGLACAVLFGGVTLLGLLGLRRRQRIVLLEQGLRWELASTPAFVAWDEIEEVSVVSINGASFLGLDVAHPAALQASTMQRRLSRLNRAVSRSDVAIALVAFGVEPEQIADAVAAYVAEPALRREIGARSGVDRLAGRAAPLAEA